MKFAGSTATKRLALWLVVLLAALEGVVRWRRWGEVPPSPREGVRGVVKDAPPSSPTLVVLGDSIPWGKGLPSLDMAWPARLGVELAERGTPWRVVDVSLPGETSLQGWARWHRDVLPWHPQRVFIAFGLNDCHLHFTPEDAWLWAHLPQGLGRYVRLWHALRVALMSPPANVPPQHAPRLTPDQTATVLTRMLKAAQRSRIEAWVLTPPPPSPQARQDWPPALREYQLDVCRRTREVLARVAYRQRAGLVDVWASMWPPQASWYQEDGIHLTAAGHQQVVRAILEAVPHW